MAGRRAMNFLPSSIASRFEPPQLLVAAALVLLPPLYFYSAIVGDVALVQGDGWTQNFGVRVLIGRMIASGEWPLWNPYIFAGTPLLASIYPGALYPPNWIFALLPPEPAMDFLVVTTYHIAIIGTYLYARRIGATRTASLLAATAFTFGGYMISHLGHTSRIAAAAWLPWILLAIENLYLAARWRWAALGAGFIALQLFAGEPQMTFYTVLLCGAYWLFTFVLRAPQSRLRFVFASAAMAVCGLLLSMVQLLPERELLGQGERARITYEYFSGYSLPPQQIFTLIFPYFFGGAGMEPYKVAYWGEWSIGETCGYVGLLTLLLGLMAFRAPKHRRLAWFWAGAAVVSCVLAWGAYLPFDLNYALHALPVYNLFRASARHMFEFTFSVSVLAALGLTALDQLEWTEKKRALLHGAAVFIFAVAATAVAYRFFGDRFVTATPRPSASGSLLIPDALFPLTAAILSLIAVWLHARRKSDWTAAALVVVLCADLGVFGQFYQWPVYRMNVTERTSDPASVRYIKDREPDHDAFRIISYSTLPFAYNYEMLNYPNVSIARRLHSVNGYDALRLVSMAEIAGDMTLDGLVVDRGVFGAANRGLELLNVKYLLRERPRAIDPSRGVLVGGVRFEDAALNLNMSSGSRAVMRPGGVRASELVFVTTMSNSTHIGDGAAIVRIRLKTADGREIERELQAGRDTSEWAFDREDVRREIKHSRAPVAETWDGGGFPAHRYLARIEFPRAEVESIEIEYAREDAELLVYRASLYDDATGASTGLDAFDPDPQRWRMLESFGEVDLYENVQSRPRAWFVRRALSLPRRQALEAIKTGRLPDASPFDPAETALFDAEDFGGRPQLLPPVGDPAGAEVKVTSYGAHRIEISTRNPQPGFLVLSEIYYRGWEAWVDGRRVPVEKVNHALRGVAVAPGVHRVEFVFRAHSFRTGAVYSGVGALLLIAGGIGWRRRKR
ncbi:MAG: YfhO family protein [Blastocatellales bacterium]|nr:YfhO family protein [Blastocatellales bacterium]